MPVMSKRTYFLLFGGQSIDVQNCLAGFCRRNDPGLYSEAFLQQITPALQAEIDKLSAAERLWIPDFSSVEELSKRYYENSYRSASIDSALLVVTELAYYIEQAEKMQADATSSCDTFVIGHGQGLFAGLAVSLAPSLPTLISLGVQMVLMAFRTGLVVSSARNRITQANENDEWAYTLPHLEEVSVASVLDEFHESNHVSIASRAYISTISPEGITISGPPATLKSLLEGYNYKPISLPVYGPYHASHLHASVDIERMLCLSDPPLALMLSQVVPGKPMLSPSSGVLYAESEAKSLLIAVVRDVLLQPSMYQKILSGCVGITQQYPKTSYIISTIGIDPLSKALAAALEESMDSKVSFQSMMEMEEFTSTMTPRRSRKRSKLAIVGMSGRFPDAESHEKLWELLEQGLDVHREVPPDRFDHKTHVDPTGKTLNTSHTPYGCWIKDPGLFDPRFFNMSPREAFQTDPMQRLALSTAYEALEMSGYVPNRTRSTRLDRIGTFYGQTSDDWREINAAQEIDTYYITGGVRAFGPGRINYHFGFSGPSFSIDTACSSSMAAMQLACTSLWAHDCDTAVVGGLSCMTNSDIFAGLSRGQFLSKNGPCSTFDDAADGYCRADGVGTVIVKRLEDAQADKDNILAVILGTATNHSANAVSITHPHGETQEALYNNILDMAGLDPLDVNYVEMHGTGTQAGDATEMKSVTNVFAPPERKRSSHQPLYLGSVKANVGHGEAASGITAIIKCLLMLSKNAIPPHVGIKKTINHTFPKDLADRNINITLKKAAFPRLKDQVRRIYVSNFSAAGGNSGLLLEDGPLVAPTHEDPRDSHLITISAKSKSAMLRNAERLITYLDERPNVSLADLAYTTTARRIQHNWRLALSASSVTQAKNEIKSKLNEEISPISSVQPKVAFVFTGQGSHYPGLGKELFETSSLFHDCIIDYDGIATLHGFPSFLPLIDGSVNDIQELSPIIIQLGLLCFEMAMARLWISWGIKPSVVFGHSLGEYAALHVAGVLSASDAIYIVGIRAQLLVKKCSIGSHLMLAVQGSISAIKDALRDLETDVSFACLNGPRETVISGQATNISNLSQRLLGCGFKCTQLKVPYAFHSAQVDVILEGLERHAQNVQFNTPRLDVISPLLGRVLGKDDAVDAIYIRRHAREAVNFTGALDSAHKIGVINENTLCLEVGPHPVCINMVKATLGSTMTTAVSLRRNESAYKIISGSLATLCMSGGRVPASHKILQEEVKSKLSTTTIHKITKESSTGDSATVETESDLARDDLRAAVMGHLVNGAGLCPSSLYADMAMTVSQYAYSLLRSDRETVGMNVANMEVFKPLIARPDGKSQILKLIVNLNINTGQANLVFSSGSDNTFIEHATCLVYFGDSSAWLSEWQRHAYLIQSRIDWLKDAELCGKASKIGRGLAYKLFAALVDYDPKYRGMEEVILSSGNMEATSRVVFQTTAQDGTFYCSPYWIDSVAHISGFIVNGSDAVDSRDQVYVSHGWESLRIAEQFSKDKTYRSYVKMQPAGGKMVAGDVFVFDEDRVIAVVGGLKFQCIPRKMLNTFLPPLNTAAPVLSSEKLPGVAQGEVRTTRAKKLEVSQVNMTNIHSVNTKLTTITSQALDILAKEIGVNRDELVDNIAFSDLGVDSLMSLTVSGRMREELEIQVHSSVFLDHPTIGDFKRLLGRFERRESTSSMESASSDYSSDHSSVDFDEQSPISTPDEYLAEPNKGGSLVDIIRNTIAQEMGIEVKEVSETPNLANLGMDSLMSLSIMGALREKTGLSLPSDLLITNPSIKDIERALNIGTVERSVTTVISSENHTRITVPERCATSVLLQGRSKSAIKHLWIVPDGGGSATSYVDIPDISPEVAVWGLNSPYMKVPEEYTCGVVGMAEKFISEIKRRQPEGPYLLAGWSAGGVIAFEILNQLIKRGDKVDHIIMIDSPCPLIIEPLPSSLHRWFASIGLLGEGDGDLAKLPSWLLPHFAASVKALSTYTAEVIEPHVSPKVTAIWCEDGVCKLPTDPRPDPYPYGHAQFLLENRTDFGPNLWDSFLPADKFHCVHMPGNHFTMMTKPYVQNLGNFIRETLL